MPTPYSPELEKAYMPDAGRLLAAIQRAML
jgi:pyruvate/2-oxoglutarate/acetoin dehydrogenase E1 component